MSRSCLKRASRSICAIIAEIGGTIGFEEVKKNRHIVVRDDGDQRSYLIPFGARLR